jgi:hypothetical protein
MNANAIWGAEEIFRVPSKITPPFAVLNVRIDSVPSGFFI